MDQLVTIVGTSGFPALLYYSIMFICAVFLAGWLLNGKLQKVCEDNNKSLDEKMTNITNRIDKLEGDVVRKDTHTKDMSVIHNQLSDIQRDVREGFIAQAARIDALFSSKN